MSDYKKKRPNSMKRAKSTSRSGNSLNYDSIGFNEQNREKKQKKPVKRGRSATPFLAVAALVFTVIVAYAIIVILHPVGVFEYFSGVYASTGSGSGYDLDINGGKPLYTVNRDNKYFLVTDSSVNCYNTNGKIIFERAHSYSDPVVKVSDTRYLLYDQGEKEISVSTLSKSIYSRTFDHGIINAAIADAGGYAVATKTEGYDSSVSVFDKNNKKVYEWFSADETVNSLALSSNGKTLAVSTLKVEDGKFITGVYVFEFDSANPVMKRVYTDEVVYQLYAVSDNSFCAVFSDRIDFLNHRKDTVTSHQSEYSVSVVKQTGNRIVVLRTVAANQDECLLEVYKNSGKLICSFKVDNYITDFSYRSGKIYTLGLSEISKYDLKGNLLSGSDASYDALFIQAVSDDNIACIRNSSIEKHTLTKTGDRS